MPRGVHGASPPSPHHLLSEPGLISAARIAVSLRPTARVQIRAANSLMSTIHSMKLLLLLSDEAQIAKRRDAELRGVQAEKTDAQKRVAVLLDELLLSSKSEGQHG